MGQDEGSLVRVLLSFAIIIETGATAISDEINKILVQLWPPSSDGQAAHKSFRRQQYTIPATAMQAVVAIG